MFPKWEDLNNHAIGKSTTLHLARRNAGYDYFV
jgi:hypothetical protein